MTDAELWDLPIVDDTVDVDKLDVLLNNISNKLGAALTLLASRTPPGEIKMWGKSTPPPGFLICDGAAVSRTTYADLYAVIGDSFGDGDGTTTFELPNLKGKMPVGVDTSDADINVIGKTGGEKKHQLTDTELPPHRHSFGGDDAIGVEFGYPKRAGVPYDAQSGIYADGNGGHFWTAGTFREASPYAQIASAAAHNNMPPFVTMHYIIKT